MEPRFNKISAVVVESLENAIAVEQNKIILLKLGLEAMERERIEAFPNEGKAEFALRAEKWKSQKENIPHEIESREWRLMRLIQEYIVFLDGKSILGAHTGPIEKVENLFGTPSTDQAN